MSAVRAVVVYQHYSAYGGHGRRYGRQEDYAVQAGRQQGGGQIGDQAVGILISEGQMTAALSLGMTKRAAIKAIILPQALRISLPSLSNEYPEILTDSAVCYAIGVMELLTRTSVIVSQTYVTLPIYAACAGIFILLNYAGMQAISKVEKKFAIPGFGIAAG